MLFIRGHERELVNLEMVSNIKIERFLSRSSELNIVRSHFGASPSAILFKGTATECQDYIDRLVSLLICRSSDSPPYLDIPNMKGEFDNPAETTASLTRVRTSEPTHMSQLINNNLRAKETSSTLDITDCMGVANNTTDALTVTADDVLSQDPCWDDTRVRKAMASKERWTAKDFADLYNSGTLNADEFLWVVLRKELIPAKTLHSLACDFAEAALLREREAGREPPADSWKAIEVKRDWIKGKATDEELLLIERLVAATRNTARSAAWAARSAVWAATWTAERDSATQSAAWAAWAAAKATRSAAMLSAKAEQAAHVIKVI